MTVITTGVARRILPHLFCDTSRASSSGIFVFIQVGSYTNRTGQGNGLELW
jgi:hypothetical protein